MTAEVKDKDIWLERKLKDYKWQLLKNKEVRLIDLKYAKYFFLDKVRLMSFVKFAINALDKMRIEEGKQFRAKIRKIKEDYRQKVNKQRISAKARKIKNA